MNFIYSYSIVPKSPVPFGISIYRLATLSGVYSSTIAMFLTRKTKTIRLENLYFLCDALNISLSDFFADKRFLNAEPKEN